MRMHACPMRPSIEACSSGPGQTRGVLKKELPARPRATRAIRRFRHAGLKRDGLGRIKDAVSIRERPAAARDRAIPGHREGDSIAGSRGSYIATPVERQFRYVLLARVPDKNTDGVVAALVRQVQHLPRELCGSLTRDRGRELADPGISRLRPTSRSASAIPTVPGPTAPGSAASTRTPTGCCDSTSPKALTCLCTAGPNPMP